MDERGKEKYGYRRYATPWETLRELACAVPEPPAFLRPEFSLQKLDQMANRHSDTECARSMQEAKGKLFSGFRQERKSA